MLSVFNKQGFLSLEFLQEQFVGGICFNFFTVDLLKTNEICLIRGKIQKKRVKKSKKTQYEINLSEKV